MPAMRSRISPAALLVKVTARIRSGPTPCSRMRWQTRVVRTRVFPEPAPASTSRGPSTCRVASSCSGFNPWRCAPLRVSSIGDGEADLEGRALHAFEQLDAASVHALDDSAREREPDAPSPGLRAHAGLEDAVPHFGIHAGPRVTDPNAHPSASDFTRVYGNLATPAREGIQCVLDDVLQRPDQKDLVSHDAGKTGRHVHEQLDALPGEPRDA